MRACEEERQEERGLRDGRWVQKNVRVDWVS